MKKKLHPVAVLLATIALVLAAGTTFAETYRNSGPPFSIDYPEGWKILPGEGGLATRAVGPGSAMNVSLAAASRPDFDADHFSGTELDAIADGLVEATAGALRDFQLIERGRAELGGKPAVFFSYRTVVDGPGGRVETVGHYVATAHRGLVYSVVGVTQRSVQRETQAEIMKAIQSFRFLDADLPTPVN